MMNLELENAGKPLTNEQIAKLENDLRLSLPAQYREFLSVYNGGSPILDTIEIRGAPGSPTDVQVFFGIGRSIESSNLLWNMRTFSDRLPDEMLPIACDSGGNLFCIRPVEPNIGHVMYVDLERGEPMHYFVAGSFEEFLRGLG